MTKARPPLSFAQAVRTIGGFLDWPEAAAAVGLRERIVRLWSEPDKASCPTLAQALALDAAYIAAGGEGAPILESYQAQLGVRVDAATACHQALAADVAHAAREYGDALATAIAITRPGATPAEVHRAIAETNDGVGALTRVLRRLASFLPAGAGPGAGNDGGAR